jgi:hypothetical protein
MSGDRSAEPFNVVVEQAHPADGAQGRAAADTQRSTYSGKDRKARE